MFDIAKDDLVRYMWDTVPTAINYWVITGSLEDDPERISIFEMAETDDTVGVSYEMFEQAITDWSRDHAKGHGYTYFDTFAKDWLWGDYYACDYDADVVDQIFQWAAFGDIVYG